MATEYVLGLGWALWLGIFTSINPCPLATNIAAISYIGHGASNSRRVLLAGLLYALGRTLVYLGWVFYWSKASWQAIRCRRSSVGS